jgi:phenylpropionate dioxygenase-like ring-hydroxylating dioxygenase large terminal subunit
MADTGTLRNDIPQGTAYGRPPQHSNDLLTKVGPGTPCGELMRRYWQPVLAARNVTNRPKEVRILGEDLIIFRDKSGRPGLLYPRCMHRGTSLFYGRVEEKGIRCCYHGWLFDVEGNCLEQPCEPDGGKAKESARQPWYPVIEKYGFVWTYMGPPDKMPAMRSFDILDDVAPGEHLVAEDRTMSGTFDFSHPISDYSWLQMNDNVMDPFHVQVLHTTMSSVQFVPEFASMPKVEFEYTKDGVIYKAYRTLDDGRKVNRISTWVFPNIMCVPSTQLAPGRNGGFAVIVPVDDSHHRVLGVFRAKDPNWQFTPMKVDGNKSWAEMSLAEHQDFPTDYEAQRGQGPISLHSEEHLATSDKGIAMMRRMLEQNIRTVQEGGDPVGVVYDAAKAVVEIPSGNYFS